MTVSVIKKPVVGIMPTGDELVPPSDSLKTGEIAEFNSLIFSGMPEEWDAIPKGMAEGGIISVGEAVCRVVRLGKRCHAGCTVLSGGEACPLADCVAFLEVVEDGHVTIDSAAAVIASLK